MTALITGIVFIGCLGVYLWVMDREVEKIRRNAFYKGLDAGRELERREQADNAKLANDSGA